MCGFLLRTLLLGLFVFFLLEVTPAVSVVTFGGQILGSTIVAVLAAFFHTIAEKWLRRKLARIFFNSALTALAAVLTSGFLPGYRVLDVAGATFVLLQICMASALAGALIKDR